MKANSGDATSRNSSQRRLSVSTVLSSPHVQVVIKVLLKGELRLNKAITRKYIQLWIGYNLGVCVGQIANSTLQKGLLLAGEPISSTVGGPPQAGHVWRAPGTKAQVLHLFRRTKVFVLMITTHNDSFRCDKIKIPLGNGLISWIQNAIEHLPLQRWWFQSRNTLTLSRGLKSRNWIRLSLLTFIRQSFGSMPWFAVAKADDRWPNLATVNAPHRIYESTRVHL